MKKVKQIICPVLLAVFLVLIFCVPAFADYSITVDGKTLDCDVIIVDGRSMMPMRAVGNAIGLDVEWISETQTVVLSTDESKMSFGTSDGTYQADIRHMC